MDGRAVCPGCGTEMGPGLKACPACHRLVHQDRLKELAAAASAAGAAGSLTGALAAWREALELLPEGTKQGAVIVEKMARLRERIDAGEPDAPPPAGEAVAGAAAQASRRTGLAGALALLALLAWKFKFVLVFLLSKAKLLLTGLANLPALLSMFVWVGVYWQQWGWGLAFGVMVCIYVHEMGHVAAIRRYGMKASAPMFIPGIGALIRLQSRPADPIEDARIGLAGPLWGLAAAVAAWLGWHVLGSPMLGAVARVAALINLFNLLPVSQLDGGRGLRALSSGQRVGVILACAVTPWFTEERMPILIAIVTGCRLCFENAPARGAPRPFAEFVFLVLALSALMAVSIPET